MATLDGRQKEANLGLFCAQFVPCLSRLSRLGTNLIQELYFNSKYAVNQRYKVSLRVDNLDGWTEII